MNCPSPSPRPLRILHVGKFFPPFSGGMEAFAEDLCIAQAEQGHEVRVLVHAHDGSRSGVEQWPFGTVERCWVLFEMVFTPIAPAFGLVLGQAIRQFQPDVLHFHLPNPSAFWALFSAPARALPWVIHWHSDVVSSEHQRGLRLMYPLYRPFEQAMLRRAAQVIVTSPAYLESSEPLRDWRQKCTIVPLGLDSRRLALDGEAVEVWPAPGVRLLSVGRLTYYKGFPVLLQALAGTPNASLIIAGNGRDRTRIETRIRQLGLTDRVRLMADVSNATRNHLLAQCDLLCLPSLERTEAFGLVLLEAMAFGKPLLVSDIAGSGAPWLVREHGCGMLATPGDAMDWQRKLHQMVDDPALREQYGAAAREAFLVDFEIHKVQARLESVYPNVA